MSTTATEHSYDTASTFFKATFDYAFDLYHRWQCEKEYEDFADYSAAFEAYVQSYCNLKKVELKFIKATKRPFGFKFRCGDQNYWIKINSKRARLSTCK